MKFFLPFVFFVENALHQLFTNPVDNFVDSLFLSVQKYRFYYT